MKERKVLGKILLIDLVRDIDRNDHLSLKIELNGPGWGTTVYLDMESDDHRTLLKRAMKDANKTTLEKMRNVPIEATIEGNMVKHWRVLIEVI